VRDSGRSPLPQAEFTEDESGELLIKCGIVEDDGTVSECKKGINRIY
jgi:hypothetical protein